MQYQISYCFVNDRCINENEVLEYFYFQAQVLHNAVRNETLENVTGHMRLLLEFAVDYSVLLKYSWFGFLPRSPIARGMGEQQPFRNLIGVIHLLHRARRLRYGKCSLEEIHEGIEKFLKRKLRCHALFVKKQNYVVQSPGQDGRVPKNQRIYSSPIEIQFIQNSVLRVMDFNSHSL